MDEISTSDDILTHAAFSTDEGRTLLLAVHTVGKKLRLYRVAIDWQVSPGKDQAGSLPKVTLQHLETVDEFQPASEQNNLQSNHYMMPSFEARLSHLELLPPALDMLTKENTLPTILATFSYLPPQYNGAETREQPFSIISRWELRSGKLALHSAFMSLTSKKASSPSTLKEETALRRLEDVRLDRIVVQIQLLSDNITLSIAYSDGSVEFRDRTTLQNLPLDDMPNKATSLPQIGFRFGIVEPCLHMALSQHRCIKVFFGSDHEPKMSFLQPDPRDIEEETLFSVEKARAAFTLHQFRGAILGNNPDDILATMHDLMTHLTSAQTDQLTHGFLTDNYKISGMNFDRVFDVHMEKLLALSHFQRGLSLQSALGNRGPQVPRTVPSKLAWLMLNMRLMGLGIMFAYQNSGTAVEGTSDLNRPEILQTFIPLATWSMTLADYLLDQLFELNRALSPTISLPALHHAITTSASPAIHLLLTSTSRTLLKHLFRGLRGLASLSSSPDRKAIPTCAALNAVFASAAISPAAMEHLLLEIDSLIKTLYENAAKAPPSSPSHIPESARPDFERAMAVTGVLPAYLDPVLLTLVTGVVEDLRGKGLQEGDLYFSNFYNLGVGAHPAENEPGRRDGRRAVSVPMLGGGGWGAVGPPRGVGAVSAVSGVGVGGLGGVSGLGGGGGGAGGSTGGNGKPVGVVRIGGKDIKLRACARCTEVMEDVPQTRAGSAWITNLQRLCYCGGLWVV
ncbi:mediator complex subunit [Trapelia coarctata]|nr:mediator complex subunit [Trapelia coarctata]